MGCYGCFGSFSLRWWVLLLGRLGLRGLMFSTVSEGLVLFVFFSVFWLLCLSLVLWVAGGVLVLADLHCCSRAKVVWFVFFYCFASELGVVDDYDLWWLSFENPSGFVVRLTRKGLVIHVLDSSLDLSSYASLGNHCVWWSIYSLILWCFRDCWVLQVSRSYGCLYFGTCSKELLRLLLVKGAVGTWIRYRAGGRSICHF